MNHDPQTQTPEQREAELRAAGWRADGWIQLFTLGWTKTWQAPSGERYADAYGAWCVMRAERGKQ